MNKIERLKNIINEARSKNHFVSVDFIKKNGETRHMTLGRSKALETAVKGTYPESTAARRWTLNQKGMLCVEEMTADHKPQWRTVNLNTVTRIKTDGQETTFNS